MNEDDVFDDLMNDDKATGMVDPISGQSYNPLDDFEEFQENSPATRVVREEDEAPKEDKAESLMDNFDEDGNKIEDEEKEESKEFDFISEYLKSKGVNPESIKIQDEESEDIKEVKFSDLSDSEKLELLKYNSEENDFDEDEITAINFLRENNMSLNELATTIRDKTIKEMEERNSMEYTVDDFSDDELFILDFKNKYGDDFSDEELETALEKAKEDDELFNKQASKIRENFKEIEQENIEAKKQEKLKEDEARESEYINKVVDVARRTNDMHDTVDMDDDDKEEVLSFMFDKTASGKTALDKALLDPETRYKVAWYIKNGDEVFKEIHNYYKNEINKLSKQKENKSKAIKPEAFIKKEKQHTKKRPLTLDDLYN